MDRVPESDEEPAAAPAATEELPALVAPAARKRGLFTRLREYIWDWRAVVAVCVATFIIGGLAGLALGLALGNGGRSGHHEFRRGPGTFRHGQQGRFGPGGQMPGQGQGFGPGNGQAPNGQ